MAVIKNHDGVTFYNNGAMCYVAFVFTTPLLSHTHKPCAAFNGLFVLGMLIKIKNHLGNKSSLYTWCVYFTNI